ncbi:EAL domain-containing protein [Aliihoeflea sp. 40Bstr573]|uniref:sensor domain-containing phosphodiesterase n=1 Tax=Aliihoeflea sp. 40Bstr573 TaxID=2696467 RepID=UPI002094115D|nr:EAL domain-containing protein [Aliihoeflea sp. 40Bstr573]MCO6387084.1 EAL domain-containing protein [Aliihoeflea sp. 40Bstr573]
MNDFETLRAEVVSDTGKPGDIIQDALVAIRDHLGMEVGYFSEFVDGYSVFRRVDAPGLDHLIKVGDTHPLDNVYCNHILEGRLPELIPDTSLEPIAQAMPITAEIPIGSHVSVPIRMADGSPFGMFCCLSQSAKPSLNERDLATMRVFADIVARQVNTDTAVQRSRDGCRTAIEGVLRDRAYNVLYQPVVDLRSKQTVAYEALCRFAPQPYRAPDQWFRDAVEVGLGIDLEVAVLAKACEALGHLPPLVRLSVNVSPDAILSEHLESTLATVALDRIILEVTEHTRISDYERINDRLAAFRDRGAQIAVDDAGAGYAGLQQIVRLAPEIIKMDMSLTRGIDDDPALRALARAIVSYADETRSTVLAEGIETESELATLLELGVALGQGYYLGRPLPLPDFH